MSSPSNNPQRGFLSGIRRGVAFAVALPAMFAATGCTNRESGDADSSALTDSSEPQRTSSPDSVPAAPPIPPRSTSPFLNTGPEVAYVGSEACRECHVEETRTFGLSHHSKSLAMVKPEGQPQGGVVEHAPSRRSYRVEWTGDAMVHHESVMGEDGSRKEIASHPIKFQVGSGSVARTYLVEDDGFLIESPVTWFTKRGQWDMSPGYESADQMAFNRVVRSGCLYCHAGHVDNPRQNGLKHHITELSIGCERCHGPGADHVKLHRGGAGKSVETDETIVNPAKLSRELSEDVCAQCHLNADVQATIRGRRPDDYRPGLPLSEYRLEFREAKPDPELKIAGHVEQLRESQCWQKSKSLTCITCHDPHADLSLDEQLAKHRSTCVDCHQQEPCRESATARDAVGDDCLKCHMPSAGTEVTHVAFTHHRIGVHRDSASARPPEGIANVVELIPLQSLDFLDEADRNRSLGLAQLTLVRREGKSAEQMPRLQNAGMLLRKAYGQGIRDPETLTALAGVARDMNQAGRGIALAKEAVESDEISTEGRIETLDVLAELYVGTGQLPEAADCLREITQGFRSAMHWFLLGQVEKERGNLNEAIAAFRKAIELAPDAVDFRRGLVTLLEQAGQKDEAEREGKLIDE